MVAGLPSLEKLAEPVSQDLRDAYLIAQYDRLVAQSPLLHCALIALSIAAIASADTTGSLVLHYAVPVLVGMVSLVRLGVWLRRPGMPASLAAARQIIHRARVLAIGLSAICSVWSILGWVYAAPETALYYPLFITMGSMATIVCLSMSRSAAYGCMLSGQLPIVLAMMLSGQTLAIAAGAAIATTNVFLAGLIRQQHDKMIELIGLQSQMHDLANTDPLTSLSNRRVLYSQLRLIIDAAREGDSAVLMMIDLDSFKPVNDSHGHGAGDQLLRQVARRLVDAAGSDGQVCRLGGDEFAILVTASARRSPHTISTALLASLASPFTVEGATHRIGASLGQACWPIDGNTPEELICAADRELYLAKAEHKQSEAARGYTMRPASFARVA